VLLSAVLVLGNSAWFSASAVVPQLRAEWGLTGSSAAWLTIAVQIGFVVGAVASSLVNLADITAPRRVILLGGAGAAIVNALLLVADGPATGIPLRFATGFFLAGVYPPTLKLISTWFREGRGTALGVLGGAIVAGNALPFLVTGLGGLDWRFVVVVTSILTLVGAVVAEVAGREGPFPFPRATFDPRKAGEVFTNRGVRLATIGYIGHMWELFAMIVWFAVFFAAALEARGLPVGSRAVLAAFVVITMGSLGSWLGGVIGDRWGRTRVTSLMMTISGGCSILIGLLFGGPIWLILLVGLVWGFTVVADSLQFSAIITELADQAYVGTALTLQLALGFTITVATIWLVPILSEAVGWRWSFAFLAPGPLIGTLAMLRLRSLPEAERIAGGRG
jgi:MFS family permease